MNPLCIYHANCADGFTAAWVVRKAYDGSVDFHAASYGEPPPVVDDRDVIIVDFSYKRDVLTKMYCASNSLVVLDHHQSAKDDLESVPWEPDAHGTAWDIVFDMDHSGAGIAWDSYMNGPRPSFVNYVEDRDLWRFKLQYSREINAALSTYEFNFDTWDQLERRPINDLMLEGAAVARKHLKDVRELLRTTQRTMVIAGFIVPTANVPPHMCSDAGNAMADGDPNRFAACYWDTPNGRTFSLRSASSGMDVAKIAEMYGGGGHRHASGFQAARGWEGE